MGWKKISSGVEMWREPCLGTVKVIEGKRFMALCVQPGSKRPYRGLARQVIDREGSEDMPGYIDISKLVVIESKDLLDWKIVSFLDIREIDDIIEKLQTDKTEFLGLEDPDILLDKEGNLKVYFTIAFKCIGKDKFEVFLGHASGKSLEKLKAGTAVIGPIGENIEGFKEIAPSDIEGEKHNFHLAEGLFHYGDKGFSAITVLRAQKFGGEWNYEKIALHPWKIKHDWCNGHVSPCRILPRGMIDAGKDLRVLVINGRQKTKEQNGKKYYGKFRPGLALYNPSVGEITWVDKTPLIEDPEATTITFASEVFPWDKEHCLVYAQVNDSFVRVYKVAYSEIKKRLPN